MTIQNARRRCRPAGVWIVSDLALGQRRDVATDRAGEQLAWAADFVLGVADHFVQLCDPADGACQGKNAGEQVHRDADGALNDAGVEVHIGVELALEDDYFVQRKLYPNVDFYSGIVQRAIGIPVSLFTAIFALARTVGWIAQLNEMIGDPEYKIGRPRQLFTGAERRDVLPISKR